MKDIKNIVDYDTESYNSDQNIEYIATQSEKARNQIISSIEQKNQTTKI